MRRRLEKNHELHTALCTHTHTHSLPHTSIRRGLKCKLSSSSDANSIARESVETTTGSENHVYKLGRGEKPFTLQCKNAVPTTES